MVLQAKRYSRSVPKKQEHVSSTPVVDVKKSEVLPSCESKEKIKWHRVLIQHIIASLRNFSIKKTLSVTWYLISFIALIFVYFSTALITKYYQNRFIPFFLRAVVCSPLLHVLNKLSHLFDPDRNNSISRIHLIELALSSMTVKKTRSFVTVGGMAVGIAIIVFLVSLGYGLQSMVIGKVARLDEMKQTDVRPQAGSRVVINDRTLSTLNDISGVDQVMPLIAVVGKVSFNNSSTDVAVYGVTADYLNASAIKPTKGRIFGSNEISMKLPVEPLIEQAQNAIELQDTLPSSLNTSPQGTEEATFVDDEPTTSSAMLRVPAASSGAILQQSAPQVAGISTQKKVTVGEQAGEVSYRMYPGEWIKVRSLPSTNGDIIGYTRRDSEEQSGLFYFGDSYTSDDSYGEYATQLNGQKSGLWIKSTVPLWQQEECREVVDPECVEGSYKIKKDENGKQLYSEGYSAVINMTILSSDLNAIQKNDSNVLGEFIAQAEQTENTTPQSSASSDSVSTTNDAFIEVASESAAISTNKTFLRKLPEGAIKEVVINRSFAKILGLEEANAVGKTINTSFILTSDLLDQADKKIESVMTGYTIVGVIPDDGAPVMYVPFVDLRALGVSKFTQVKVSITDQKNMNLIRKSIESFGFSTTSVADTVEQINSLFGVMRTILGILGLVALFVASLGMFNTLTVSLLERTHEVGLMKAMGMKSNEVQELFLTESIIMGLLGGFFGVILGFAAGQAMSALISVFSVSKGFGYLQISVIPIELIIVVVVLSFIVGITTGIYPAMRAKKISALHALRYE